MLKRVFERINIIIDVYIVTLNEIGKINLIYFKEFHFTIGPQNSCDGNVTLNFT